jgi:hypothetical protein
VAHCKGFENQMNRDAHFEKHVTDGREFTFESPSEYETAAIAFMTKQKGGNIVECVRERDHTVIRCDTRTKECCMVNSSGYLTTYFVVKGTNIKAYFNRRCERGGDAI